MTPEKFAEKYLSPPIAKRYLSNIVEWNKKSRGIEIRCGVDFPKVLAREYIGWAFSWTSSPEGREYWLEINNSVMDIVVTEQ